MSFPTRLSFVTLNLWNVQRWKEREAAVRAFFNTYRPDVFCVQELRPETRKALDKFLPDYQRVDDPFPGWSRESNIYWNSRLLDKIEHGAADIGIASDENRALFWARLGVRETGQSLFVSTAHYTYQEHPQELKTGFSPRVDQARNTAEALNRLVKEGEAGFFMGDLNDPILPALVLNSAGYQSCFKRLGLVSPTTWPAIPTALEPTYEVITAQTIDWMVSNQHARPIAAQVPQFYTGDMALSDHWPVMAVYELGRV